MKIVLTGCFWLHILKTFAQNQIYYNKNVEFDNTHTWNAFTNLFIDNDTIYTTGVNNIPNALAFYINKFDKEATLLLSKSYYMDSTYFYGGQGANSLLKIKNNFYSIGSLTDNNQLNNGWYVKFNASLDTILTKKRNILNSAGTTYRFSLQSNNDIITLGDVGYYDSIINFNFGQVYLVKFDTLANIIWEHELGYPGAISEFVKGIYPANDGGYFIYGYKVNYQAYAQFYLLKVDSMGVMQWQRNWGGIYHDALYGFYEMPDGNLLVSGYASEDFFGSEVSKSYLALLTPDGSQRIWEKRFFWFINFTDLNTIFHNADGTFDIWGEETNYAADITHPFLMKFNANLDSIDTKYYSYWNGSGAQNYMRDVVKMPDGGYVLCGFGWDDAHDEDGWLLRIDSNGCANVNCTPLAIEEPTPLKPGFDFVMFPNPANDKVQLLFDDILADRIEIMDLAGKLLYSTASKNTKVEIDLTVIANGFYLVKAINVIGQSKTKRLIIARKS